MDHFYHYHLRCIEPEAFFHRQHDDDDEYYFEHAADSCASCFASWSDIRLCSLSGPLMSRVKNNKRPRTVSLAKWITHTSIGERASFSLQKSTRFPPLQINIDGQPNFSNTVKKSRQIELLT